MKMFSQIFAAVAMIAEMFYHLASAGNEVAQEADTTAKSWRADLAKEREAKALALSE